MTRTAGPIAAGMLGMALACGGPTGPAPLQTASCPEGVTVSGAGGGDQAAFYRKTLATRSSFDLREEICTSTTQTKTDVSWKTLAAVMVTIPDQGTAGLGEETLRNIIAGFHESGLEWGNPVGLSYLSELYAGGSAQMGLGNSVQPDVLKSLCYFNAAKVIVDGWESRGADQEVRRLSNGPLNRAVETYGRIDMSQYDAKNPEVNAKVMPCVKEIVRWNEWLYGWEPDPRVR